jgi:hypothetical protein
MASSLNNTYADDLLFWMRQEILSSQKAAQLRVHDATDIVTSYLACKISVDGAEDRLKRYQSRWGEAIRGVSVTPEMTDKEILSWIDKAKGEESFCGRIPRACKREPQGGAER